MRENREEAIVESFPFEDSYQSTMLIGSWALGPVAVQIILAEAHFLLLDCRINKDALRRESDRLPRDKTRGYAPCGPSNFSLNSDLVNALGISPATVQVI